MRLDQFLAKKRGWSARTARSEVLNGCLRIDGNRTSDHLYPVTKFSRVEFEGELLQEGLQRVYLMANKMVGTVSATQDLIHETILDGIDLPERETLHLAGRLDRSSSGLVLLSNDGHWTSGITSPENHLPKVYRVETDREIPIEAVTRFQDGFHFLPENIHTLPAHLELLGSSLARVTLFEGRYHQIKRMFHRLDGIRLRSLHREKIGEISLPDDLAPGQWRHLSPEEFSLLSPEDIEKEK